MKNNFCLEEYITYLHQFTFEKSHLFITDDDESSYEIYYVKAEKGETDIPVPKEGNYSISGDNVDGFIVTIQE